MNCKSKIRLVASMKRTSFTMIELVFIIIILGILSSIAIPKFIMGREDACYVKLRANLSETQSELSRQYTKYFMQGKKIPETDLLSTLNNYLASNTSGRCQFKVNNVNSVTATIGRNTLNMNITTDTDTKTPTITCDLSDPVCQRLTGKHSTN